MTLQQLRAAQTARPFRPFSLRTGDGREYAVPHPETLLITPGGRTVIVVVGDEAVELIDLLLITSLHFETQRPRRRRNGRSS